jgi:hypothetical protein
MKPWVEDAIEQIATADVLNCAGTSTGERLAYIVCDNAIEFMMIAYVEKQAQLVHTKIKPRDWDLAKSKFHSLLNFVVANASAVSGHQSDIQTNHDTRNNLYHTGQPLSVKSTHVEKYLVIARDLVHILFSEKLSKDDWAQRSAAVSAKMEGSGANKIKALLTVQDVNDVVQIETSHNLTDHALICVVLDAFMTRKGLAPTTPQLEQSLRHSHAPHLVGANLSKRIYDCRKKGLIQKGTFALTAKGAALVKQTSVSQ